MTTTYTFDQLKEDVRKEAEALRIHATKEEREGLDFEDLDPSDKERCIYGQMTGHCHNERASKLIDACALRHFESISASSVVELAESMQDKSKEFIKDRMEYAQDFTYSAIEAYILLPEARNANLISFLRGETETLEL
jgi:hypothetical protein